MTYEQMAELARSPEREVKGEGKVYYDRGGGWYFIGPLWKWEIGDLVELPSKDGIVVEVVKPAKKWDEEDGMMEARIAEDYRI